MIKINEDRYFGNYWFHETSHNLKWKSLLLSISPHNTFTIIWKFPALSKYATEK